MEEDDDPSKGEQSHYVKFLELQAQFPEYVGCQREAAEEPPAAQADHAALHRRTADQGGAVWSTFPTIRPMKAIRPSYQPIAAFCSGLFQYMLIMIETIYRVPPEGQKLFFNEGLHRSMIWVLDKYAQTLRQTLPLGGRQVHGPDLRERQSGAARNAPSPA